MLCTIISIGDELLIGQVVNTNASWLGDQLTRIGIRVREVLTIGDERTRIRTEIERCAAESDLLVISGGLGPTHDDMTREAICELLGCDMQMDQAQLKRIERRFAASGIELNDRSVKQALTPSACRVLPNDYGSAPGLVFSIGKATAYVLPGVPSEFKGIFIDWILPEIAGSAGDIDQTTILLFGPTESGLADILADLNELLGDDLTLAYLPAAGGIRLRAMRIGGGEDARDRYTRLVQGIREKAGEWLVAERDEPLAAALGALLVERGLTLATAESCTGGMIGSLLTDTPGCSGYFLGGVIAYANSAKQDLLGVSPALLEEHGAVSQQVAEAMAIGARARFGADLAAAVTGIAGPEGGTPEKPVGTVWIAVAGASGVISKQVHLGRERSMIRLRSANIALDMVRRVVMGGEGKEARESRSQGSK